MAVHYRSKEKAVTAPEIHHNFFRLILAGKMLLFALMVVATFVATLPANSQVVIENLVKDQQIQINPDLGIQIKPNVVCFPPFIKKNNQCVCPVGQQKVGNTCKPFVINPGVLCVAPFKPNAAGTKCVCPLGMKKVGNTCKPFVINPGIVCVAPFKPNAAGTKCVCPLGMKKVGNTCKPFVINPGIVCVAPFVPNNAGTKCVCPQGFKKVGNTCKPKQNQILCQVPFVPNNAGTKCVCPWGTIPIGNTCINVNDAIPCPAPMFKQNGQCVCPAGLDKVGNKCLPPIEDPICDWPFVYKQSTNTCVCAQGYRLNNNGNQCIKKPVQPSISKETIAEIQNCLNRLGYDAGPVDGASGNRTRNAWRQFRRDEGLQGRPQSLSDAVTQDRLFQACARVNNTPTPDPVPDPVPQDNSSADTPENGAVTNFDPETGYPSIQCASEAVAILLQGLVGNADEIGICGEVCVPIPDGMTPEQVEGTSASVNWCRHCTTIGENGLLCSGEPEGDDEAAN